MAKAQSFEEAFGQVQVDGNPFAELLSKAHKPRDDFQQEEINEGWKALVGAVLTAKDRERFRSLDAIQAIKQLIVQLDKALSAQMDEILHHEEFRKLEGTWRGLHYLVYNTEHGEDLQVRVLNVKKEELAKTFNRYSGSTWDRSPIYKKIYGAEFDMLNGTPYGAIVADYYFDHSSQDVKILNGLAQVCAAAHCPVITAPSPNLFGMDSWTELATKDVKVEDIFRRKGYEEWRDFRDSEDSRYVGLAMPRALARLPYDPKENPIEEFNYEEDTASGSHDRFTWMNAAYAMGMCINRAFKEHGWCAQIAGPEAGGKVEKLPVYKFPTDEGLIDTTCPTEVAIGDRRWAELANFGMIPLVHAKNTNYSVFMEAPSAQKPKEYDDPTATRNAKMSAALPYLFSCSRFAHFLKHMVRNKLGKFTSKDQLEQELNKWITNYVCDPDSGDEVKVRMPLQAAQVTVTEDPDDVGVYRAKFELLPHYQLKGLDVTLSLSSRLSETGS